MCFFSEDRARTLHPPDLVAGGQSNSGHKWIGAEHGNRNMKIVGTGEASKLKPPCLVEPRL